MPDTNKPLPVSSSQPPQFAPEQEYLFREVLKILNADQVPCAVSGAFALHEHTGIWRDTKDLDVFLAADQVSPVMQALNEVGFETEICDPVWLCKARQGSYFVDLISGMSNGVIRVDQSWINRASESEAFGIPVKVLAPEELIASKLFVAFRERFDGSDIAHVIYAAGKRMDWRRILDLAGEHWGVLLWSLVLFHYVYPSSDAVPKWVWSELLSKFISEVGGAEPKAEFRGSLIDERMFAIDVSEWKLENLIEKYRAEAEPKIEEPKLREIGEPAA
ncbi:MAG: hypothetical protein DMG61_03745 [Acidobacteria bacterium]|nr:MAG: hypothetical protein DMG61_03745 [Acidobacteriota bacterium]